MIDHNHIYNLKAVTHEVGLSAATLRAWERRYGLLKPQRSPGGHRLYSRQDIEMLKWLVQKQNEGLSISHAVEMWQRLHEGDQNSLVYTLAPAAEISFGEGMLDELLGQWIAACTAFDDQAANRVIDQAFAIAPPETICTEVLQKGLAQIGEGWYTGSNSVQQEHFASAIAIRRIDSLLAAAPPPTRAGHILAACPPGEEHDFILLMVAYLLRRSGWDVVYLGANVPLNDLDSTIQSTQPTLIISAAQTLESAASLRKMSEFLETQQVPLAFGGGIFQQTPESIHSISGHYLGDSIAMISEMVERLVTTLPAMHTALPISREYAQTLDKFNHNQTLIINEVASATQSMSVETAHMEIANTNFTHMIGSALTLGNINLLDHSIIWLNGLIENRGLSQSGTVQFYAAYQKTIESYLGEDGAIIRDWLSKFQLHAQLNR
jgi:DNA-binding transcriptional MerR regulator